MLNQAVNNLFQGNTVQGVISLLLTQDQCFVLLLVFLFLETLQVLLMVERQEQHQEEHVVELLLVRA